MKNVFFILLFLGFCFISSAQSEPKVGDELTIKEPSAQSFNYVFFPKANFLMKRGIVTKYKSVYDNAVIVDDVVTKDKGKTYVVLKKKDGSKFFGYLNSVKASYQKAIEAGELKQSI